MNYDNYYNILNLSKNANLNDIKKAYRQLSIKFPPDKNLNCDSEQFNKINEDGTLQLEINPGSYVKLEKSAISMEWTAAINKPVAEKK